MIIKNKIKGESHHHFTVPVDDHEVITLKLNIPEFNNIKHLTIRTGVLGDGSCMYHCLLYILDYDNYTPLNHAERNNYAIKFRQYFKNNITLKHWQTCSGGLIAQVQWIELLNQALQSYISNADCDKIITELLFQLNDISHMFTSIFTIRLAENFYKQNSNNSIDFYRSIILKTQRQAFQNYKDSIMHKLGSTDDIDILEDLLNINIWVCDSDGYILHKETKPWKKNIILYNQGTYHWEPIGLLYEEIENNSKIRKQCLIFDTIHYEKRK